MNVLSNLKPEISERIITIASYNGVNESQNWVKPKTNLLQAEISSAVTDIYKEALGKILPNPYHGICPKKKHFTDQNGSKGGPHETRFSIFSKTKMNITND